MPENQIMQARSESDYRAARELIEEYAAQLGIDLGFQGFAAELDRLAEIYGVPSACLLLARHEPGFGACVGVRRLSADTCEMKRLYVRPVARGLGLGRSLAIAAIDAAHAAGYQRMVLDTLQRMVAALALYRSLGFRDTPPYYRNPQPDAKYLALEL